VSEELVGVTVVDGIGTTGHGRQGSGGECSLHLCVVFLF
jgi:hypothetical protein